MASTSSKSALSSSKKASAKVKTAKGLSLNRDTSEKTLPTEKVRWTFFTNHAHVLLVLAQDPLMLLREVALKIGITERAVQRIIVDLEQDGFLERQKVGRKNSYRLEESRPLRHPVEAHRTIGDVMQMIMSKKQKRRSS